MQISYEDNIFINCPFDKDYLPIFHSMIFAIHDAGFVARAALEISDGAQIRLEKIMQIISECRYGIHDISRVELDPINQLPRFNMPLELGIFLGCRKFGNKKHSSKASLIMDSEPHRYQKFISDISGQDIVPHGNSTETIVHAVRSWLRIQSKRTDISGGSAIYARYLLFRKELPDICGKLSITVNELTFLDFTYIVAEWLKIYPLRPNLTLQQATQDGASSNLEIEVSTEAASVLHSKMK
jgi:hypothetical protein